MSDNNSNDNIILKVEGLKKVFGDHVVLENINTTVKKGEVIAIIGPSGCGKSTFLRSLNLLEKPTEGHIYFHGTDITDKNVNINKLREKIGMVFQHFNLFPNMTVKKNIMLAPVQLKLMSEEEANKKALELLERVGLSDKADTYPNMLSGGQKQRVAIARAMAMNPDVMLFVVTHEMGFAKEVANRCMFFADTKIMEENTPKELFENPQTPRLQDFLSKVL